MSSVYMTPFKMVPDELILKSCQKLNVFKTIAFQVSCKWRNLIDLNTVVIFARNLQFGSKMVNTCISHRTMFVIPWKGYVYTNVGRVALIFQTELTE